MSQVTLLAEFEVKQQHLDGLLAAAQREMSRIHADEPGCPRFDVTMLSDGDRRSVLVEIFEIFKDKDAAAAHRNTPHFAAFHAEIVELLRWLG